MHQSAYHRLRLDHCLSLAWGGLEATHVFRGATHKITAVIQSTQTVALLPWWSTERWGPLT